MRFTQTTRTRVTLMSLASLATINCVLLLATAEADEGEGDTLKPARVLPTEGAPIFKPGQLPRKSSSTSISDKQPAPTEKPETKQDDELIPPPIVSSATIERKPKTKSSAPVAAPPKKSTNAAREPRAINHAKALQSVRAATFQGVTPGITTQAELKKKLGEPIARKESGESEEWSYRIGGFKRVVFVVDDELVRSAVIHLDQLVDTSKVVSELGLAAFTSIEVVDDNGSLLGAAYPERGVVLSLQDSEPRPLVSQVVLDPITPELFLMRAEEAGRTDYTNVLEDIKYAQKLDPEHAYAYWLQAELLLKLGREGLAAAAADRAVELDQGNLRYQLTQAELTGRRGDDLRALALTRKIYADEDATPFEQALAKHQLGRWTAFGKRADHQKSVQYHTQAMSQASELLKEAAVAERFAIVELLVETQCAIAIDIANGDFNRKEAVVPKWLKSARNVIAKVVKDKQRSRMLERVIDRATLEAHASCRLEFNPEEIADRAMTEATEIFNAEGDQDYAQAVHWELGCTLFHAAALAKLRGERDTAKQYVATATDLLEEGAAQRDATPEVKYLLGRAFFLGGAVEAVLFDDHAQAVAWYDQALPYMKETLPESQARDLGLHGERLVSMGVSYWSVDKQETSVTVSKAGMRMMRDAVKRQWLDEEALAVPYGNLASMYSKLSDEKNADHYERLAAQVNAKAEQR